MCSPICTNYLFFIIHIFFFIFSFAFCTKLSKEYTPPSIWMVSTMCTVFLLMKQKDKSFPMSQFLESGGQSIGVSATATIHPVIIQDRFPLGFTGLISLLSKGLSRVFSNTTVKKHQFLGVQLSLWPNPHIHT